MLCPLKYNNKISILEPISPKVLTCSLNEILFHGRRWNLKSLPLSLYPLWWTIFHSLGVTLHVQGMYLSIVSGIEFYIQALCFLCWKGLDIIYVCYNASWSHSLTPTVPPIPWEYTVLNPTKAANGVRWYVYMILIHFGKYPVWVQCCCWHVFV